MSQPADVHISVPAFTVKVERTVPEIEPPPAMEFDELQPWLADHPDLRQIAMLLIREVTDEGQVEEDETPAVEADASDDVADMALADSDTHDEGIDLETDVHELADDIAESAIESADEVAEAIELADDIEVAERVADDGDEADDLPEEPTSEVPTERALSAANAEPREEIGRRTLTLHRTLRSGAVVRFDGDVVLFGDLNPGAQVIAAGNIIVLGNLKGMAHAGATGDEDSFIMGFDLQPT